MRTRLVNGLFIAVIAMGIGFGGWVLATSAGSGEEVPQASTGGAGGNNPRPVPTGPAEQAASSGGSGSAALVAPRPAAYTDQLLTEGAQVYAANCQVCHGGSGQGNGPWSQAPLNVPARDFTDAAWMGSQSDGVFFTSILRGVPGTAMPSFTGRLTERQIWAAVAYIRGFSPKVVLDAPTSGSNETEGKQLYEAKCAGCHGASGAGNGPAASSFGTQPRNLSNLEWLNSRSDHQLRSTLEMGVPGTAMPSFAGELRPAEMDSVIRYLRQLAGGSLQPNPQVGGWAQEAYRSYCASCHGVNGDGRGPASGRIEPAPRDFRNPTWMAGQTDSALAAVIAKGRPGTAMPPFAALLSEDEITRLADYVQQFAGPQAIPGAGSAYRYDPTSTPNDAAGQPAAK